MIPPHPEFCSFDDDLALLVNNHVKAMVKKIVSDETTSDTSSEVRNSATEISTDSEFAQDEPTPTREIPSIILNDFHVTKTRGSGGSALKKIQVTTGYLQKPSSGKYKRPNIELKLKPLVPPSPIVKKPAPVLLPRTEGYALNRTQSTGGIAAKVSLELKKKYLLGEVAPSIQKSGSASTLDTKFKTFHTNISDCQKLLKPAPEISASMQTFCNKLDEIKSPVLSPQSSIIFPEEIISTPKNEDVPVAESEVPYIFENESEGRPRSPVHETSIIVPQIDWSKKVMCLSSDSLASCSSENGQISQSKLTNIPRVEVHAAKDVDDKDVIPLDSLCVESQQDRSSVHSEPVKSITSEKKSLNQPKSLPDLDIALPDIHNILHLMSIPDDKNSSGLSSPDSGGEQATAALTETELSDWARDEVVSDNFEDGEFESVTPVQKSTPKIAKMAEFDDMSYICGKNNEIKHKMIITEAMNSILSANLDIEFMDTGTETSSDDGIVHNSQSGYVLFKNEDEFAEDSLNPNVNEVVEATNVHVKEMKNTGYCVLANDGYNVVTSTVVDLKQSDLEKLAQNQSLNDHDEDSLVILETGTTTEENTFSDSTVKNVTEMKADKKQPALTENNNLEQKQRLEEKLAVVKAEAKIIHEQTDSNIAFEEHCQRLQSKIVFSNVKDSIDVRKSRRKSRPDVLQKPDLIQEECAPKDVTLNLTPASHTPDILYNKEVLKKERDDNQRLIQEMVMNKMKAENKSLERKKRTRTPLSPNSIYDLSKSATTDVVPRLNSDSLNKSAATPDVLLSANLVPLQNSKSLHTLPALNSSVAVYSSPTREQAVRPQSVNSTLVDNKLSESPMITVTPKAPPRQHRTNDDINRKLEKLKQNVRLRSQRNDNVDPHVQESIESLVINAERRNSWLYSNDTLNKKKNNTFRRSKSGDYQTPTTKTSNMSMSSNNLDLVLMRTKSIQEMPQNVQIKPIDYNSEKSKFCKSDPNILETDPAKGKKKSKDRERRKSISKLITTLFTTKKSPGSSNSKGLFSKLSPKSKDVSKSCANLDLRDAKMVPVETVRRKSLSEVFIQRNAVTPPPIPPLPLNYIVKGTDESSEGEQEHKKHDYGSCDTLDQVEALDNSTSSLTGPGRRSSKSARRANRQAQLKRHRMAQEIQRKLEETEVKTKELETRGVMVEKYLRGEDCSECSKDEPELLQEWFDLMRDRTELRRYERELTVRAQELELEDRHARLQHELRDRIENDKEKTEEDVKLEESIISEMIKIVEKRDSLIAEIEEDRIRYTCEDRDLEEQMLAKGLRLTPIKKSPEK